LDLGKPESGPTYTKFISDSSHFPKVKQQEGMTFNVWYDHSLSTIALTNSPSGPNPTRMEKYVYNITFVNNKNRLLSLPGAGMCNTNNKIDLKSVQIIISK
jgi:hypothetical protein